MADCYLVVRTMDVTGAPVRAHSITALMDGGRAPALTAVEPGIAEVVVPSGTSRVQIAVTPPEPFWPARQDVTVDTSASPPTIALAGDQQLNTLTTRVVARGSAFNLEVQFTLGHLSDVTADASRIAAEFGLSFDTPPTAIWRFGTPIINPSGTGYALLNRRAAMVRTGRLFIAARRTVPKLIVLVHPGWNAPRNPTQARLPMPFNVFFHPAIYWTDPYPYGWNYLSLISRYVVSAAEQYDKALAYQDNADGPKNVFIFPVGSHAHDMGDVITQRALFRLLQECAFFLQREQLVMRPLQPVGTVSLTCFSAGANYFEQVFSSAPTSAFERALRNVFVLDGVLLNNAAQPTAALASTLARWVQAMADRLSADGSKFERDAVPGA